MRSKNNLKLHWQWNSVYISEYGYSTMPLIAIVLIPTANLLRDNFYNFMARFNQSRTNGPINAHLTIAKVMHRYNH